MNEFMKLFGYCDCDIERMIAHIIEIYDSGRCCILCEHVGQCDPITRCGMSIARCAHSVTEYIRRLNTGDEDETPGRMEG